ncbi:MAG: hypothetical protein CME40_10750 [Haliea sp.]|nr:hypothetical protein [Haliea sp.]|tara:strand:+ start:76058 stop:76453 length:396 start_codon:yes stop_codon:yes gene_type:complete
MERTFPTSSALSDAYYAGCREGKLLLQYCSDCQQPQFYPRILCSHCGGRELAWREASGKGHIATFTVVRQPVSPAYEAPYVVALIDLEEGPRMMSHIVNCDPEAVRVGQPVQVSFENWSETLTMPVFQLQG